MMGNVLHFLAMTATVLIGVMGFLGLLALTVVAVGVWIKLFARFGEWVSR